MSEFRLSSEFEPKGDQPQAIEKLSQASDHPILLTFPESEYLKGFVCRVF